MLYGLYAVWLLAGWAYVIRLVMAGLVPHEINSLLSVVTWTLHKCFRAIGTLIKAALHAWMLVLRHSYAQEPSPFYTSVEI